MEPRFNAAEFSKLSPADRIKLCRQMALEAEQLAEKANPRLRVIYQDLAKQWTVLGEEIAREMARKR